MPLGIQNVPYVLIYLAELKVKRHKTAHHVSSNAPLRCDGVISLVSVSYTAWLCWSFVFFFVIHGIQYYSILYNINNNINLHRGDVLLHHHQFWRFQVWTDSIGDIHQLQSLFEGPKESLRRGCTAGEALIQW